MKNRGFSRRDFLKTGALSSLVVGSSLVGCSSSDNRRRSDPGSAKNIIFLVSDGMSAGTMVLADLVKQRQYGDKTNWIKLYESDRTYHRGIMDMASLDSNVTDSSAAASSWGCGKRINNGAVNMGPNGEVYKTICEIFRDAGKSTGLVTTTRITHATPSGFAINMPSRQQEDEIAQQYTERNYDVLMGGGRNHFSPEKRGDGKNLYASFQANNYTVVKTKTELQQAPTDTRLLGLFSDSHLPYMVDYNSDSNLQETVPTLAEMTSAALKRLDSKTNGFILQVEGGRVDHAAHGNDPAALIYDQIAFDEVIETVLAYTDGRDDTLVFLTTDHGNANPGLGGYGSGYRDSPQMLETIQAYRHSFDWIFAELGYHWSMTGLPGVRANRVKELMGYATNTQITQVEADMVAKAFRGEYRAPFHDRMSPGAVMAGVLANYNGIYFMGTNHTADFVELAAWGPGSDRIPGFIRNTQLFDLMVDVAGVKAYTD